MAPVVLYCYRIVLAYVVMAAVVLYYYHVDPELQGGEMEFMGR